MSIRTRIRRLAEQSEPPAEPMPYAIEQDAPGAPVRFYRSQPATWGEGGGGEVVEMDPEEFRRRYVEPSPGVYALTWSHQPWAADLF